MKTITTPSHSKFAQKSILLGACLLLSLLANNTGAAPQIAYWDPGALLASPGSGGNGNWNTTTSDWWVSGPSDTTWTSGNFANFEGIAGTVTLTASVSAGGLTFTTAGYILKTNSGTAAILTMTTTPTAISSPAGTNTIDCILAGSGGLTYIGPGSLVLGAGNTYTGTTTISGGTLQVNFLDTPGTQGPLGNSVTNNTGSIVLSGGTLQYSSANAHDYSGRFSTAANQQYNIDVNGQHLNYATVLSSSGGTLTLSSSAAGGRLILSGLNTYTGVTTINSGILQVDSLDTPGTKGPLGDSVAANPGSIVLNGGTLQYSPANAHDYSGRFSTAANQQYNIDVNAQNVTYATALTSSGGELTLTDSTGGGSLTLNADNTYSGTTTLASGTAAIGTFLTPFGNGTGTINLAGGNINTTLNRGTTAENILNPVSISGNSELLATTTTGVRFLTFGGPVSSTGGSLTITNTETTNGPALFCVVFTNTVTLNIPVILTNGAGGDLAQLAIWNFSAVGDQTYNGVISGSGSVYRSTGQAAGTGARVIFTAANTYSGGTSNNDGEIACGISSTGTADSGVTSGPIGTGTMTVGNANAKISAYGGAQVIGNHVIVASSPFTFTGANSLTMSGNFDFGGAVRTLAVSNTSLTELSGSILNGGLIVSGGNTLTLAGANAYTGATTVSNSSTLALTSTGSINNSASLSILAGSTLDVSAITSYTLSSSTVLSASGAATPATIKGASGGTVSLGSQPISLTYDGSDPALSISQGTLSLNGNAFTVNSASPLALGTYAIIQQASGNINSAGTYSVSGTAIGAGDIGTITVNGGNVNLSITTSPAPSPTITSISVSGTTLMLSGTNGTPHEIYVLLQSADATLPLSRWTTVATNYCDGSGNISLSANVVNPGNPQEYYILQAP